MTERNIVSQEIPQDENLYAQRAEEIIKQVIGQFFWDNTKITERDKLRSDFQRKIPIYLDALQRGASLAWVKLQGEGILIDEMDGLATRTYKADKTGLIIWSVSLKSNDLFARMNFIRYLDSKNQPTAGTTDFWTNSDIVKQALMYGLEDQNHFYSDFILVCSKVKEVESHYFPILRYLPSVTLSDFDESSDHIFIQSENPSIFSYIKRTYSEMLNNTDRFSPTEAFVLLSLPKQTKLQDEIARVKKLCTDIEKIYYVIDAEKVSEIDEYEATLVVELLSNPDSFGSAEHFKNPVTTLDRVVSVNRFINSLRSTTSLEDFKHQISFFAHKIIEEQKDNLSKIFTELELPETITFEYVQNLLNKLTQELPAQYEIFDNNLAISNTALGLIGNSYLLDRPVKIEDEIVQTGFVPRSVDTGLIASDFVLRNNFSAARFKSFSEEIRTSILNQIFSHPLLENDERREKIVRSLFQKLHIDFLPTKRQFYPEVPKYAVFSKGSQRLYRNLPLSVIDEQKFWPVLRSANLFISKLKKLVESGDIVCTDVIEELISRAAIGSYMQKRGYLPPSLKRSFVNLLSNTASEIIRNSGGESDIKEGFKNAIAGFSLANLYAGKIDSRNLQDIIKSTSNLLKAEVRAKELERRFGGESKNYEREIDALLSIQVEDIELRIEKLIKEFQSGYFGKDFEENKAKYILEILERSISS